MSNLNPTKGQKILIAVGILLLGISGGILGAQLMNATVWSGISTGLTLAIALSAALGIADRFSGQPATSQNATESQANDGSTDGTRTVDEAVQMILNWRANDDEPTKDDLRLLGHQGPLSVYASQRAQADFNDLSSSDQEELTEEIESLRRGSLKDTTQEPMHGHTEFRRVLQRFDLKFGIVETQPRDTEELPTIANDEASTKVGLLFTTIIKRPDRAPSSL